MSVRAGNASWNPLRCEGTALPPAWLLAAKLLAFYLLLGVPFLESGAAFLPFWAVFDAPALQPWLHYALWAAFHIGAVMLFLNRGVRVAAVILGLCVFLHIAAHRLDYANNRIFFATFLILLGLYHPKLGEWPLRIQLALIYGGAAVNKALDPAWWSGRFFDTLMIDALDVAWYEEVVRRFPDLPVGQLFGAATILTEASICALVLLSARGLWGVYLVIAFHVVMMVATGGQLSIVFLYGVLAVSAAFVPGAGTQLSFSLRDSRQFLQSVAQHPATWWSAALMLRFRDRIFRVLNSVVAELR